MAAVAATSVIPKFQFHKGTIRTTMLAIPIVIAANFNSIKVRLEPR